MFYVGDRIRRNVLVNCDHGSMIINRFDCDNEGKGHGQWLLDHGNVSTIEASATLNYLKNPESVIFDVGANIGTYATILSKTLPNSKIFCFEPQRLIFQMLCGNFAINNYDNCYAYNLALGDNNTVMDIDEPDYCTKNDFGTFSLVHDNILNKSGKRNKIEIITLDDFVNKFSIEQLDFLKIDAEGMDLAILKGGEKTLQKFSPGLLIEHTNTQTSIFEELVDYLNINNYNFEVIYNNVLATPK
jgi:FkbM family methyltransferase